MLDSMSKWVKSHKRMVILKCAIGAGLVVNHYYPSDASIFINLIWLIVF